MINKNLIYIIGHQNPDADSVFSAISYAYYKNYKKDGYEYIPAICGKLNYRTNLILDKYKIKTPIAIENIINYLDDFNSRNVILVDHNELAQSVNGILQDNILEIIDHHKLGNNKTNEPIFFLNMPVGSTCTIVAEMFKTNNVTSVKEIYCLMMAGIISDTLNLNSPTTTVLDKKILQWLSVKSDTNINEMSDLIFNSNSIILTNSYNEIIEYDCKFFQENNIKYSVSQIEENNFDNFWKHSENLLIYLEKFRWQKKLDISMLLMTDIKNQNSILIVQGNKDFIKNIPSKILKNDNIFSLPNFVSRKKQLIPFIINIINLN